MRVLVIDDNSAHLTAAKVLLKDHDLVLASTYDEAQKLLTRDIDWKQVDVYLKEAGFTNESPRDAKWKQAYAQAKEKATYRPNFDAVLSDLLLPASKYMLGDRGMQHVGKEMPLGTILAFLALAAGVKRVAVVTDTNHHDHPASAAFDAFAGDMFSPGDTRVLCTNSTEDLVPMDVKTHETFDWDTYRSDEFRNKYTYIKGAPEFEGIVRVKNWLGVLNKLSAEG